MPRAFGRCLLLLLVLAGGPLRAAAAVEIAAAEIAAAEIADPARLIADRAAASLDFGAALRIEARELRVGFATIELHSGWLIPRLTPSGWLLELLFLGEGRLAAEPPDAVESSQLELFTGGRRLDTPFTAAIFAAPVARLEELRRGGQPAQLATAQLEQARAIEAGRSELAELEVLDVDSKLLLAALGEPLADQFFAAIFETGRHGVICLGNDLEAEDPLGLGQWVAFERTAAAAKSAAAGAEGGEPEDVDGGETAEAGGVYDSWIDGRDDSLSSGHQDSRPAPVSNATFEPLHYRLAIALDPARGALRGEAEIEVEARLPSRMVKLALHGDLEVEKVADAAGGELFFERQGEVLRVFLPARLEPGQKTRLQLRYAGQFFESGKKRKSRGLRDNVAFYPHAGEVDEATYDIELRWPRGWEVLAAGELVAEGKEGSVYWQKRRIGSPTWGPSFVVGKFRRRSRQVGGVKVQLALGAGLAGSEADGREILDTAASALEYFSALFGPYPQNELTLVTAPAEISQSLLGFIALSDEMMQASGEEAAELGLEDRRTVIAHEVAHQWWGHQVGWKRWRDQWLSEAMANYAALVWARKYLPDLDPGLGPTAAWQDDLTSQMADGRSLESVGPLVLGGRLDSSLTEDAYEPIVYRKGAVVLDSLCQLWSEGRCLEAFGAIARESRGARLSTEDFLARLEQISGRDLGPFARQFIYGIGLPEVYFRQETRRTADGRWRVEIDAELESSYHFRYALRRNAAGRLAVERQRIDEVELDRLVLAAPLFFLLEEPAGGDPFERRERFEIRGARTRAGFEFAEKPLSVELDPRQEIFARFWDLGGDPKRALYYRGADRLAAGDGEAASAFFEAALAAATPAPPDAGPAEKKAAAELDRAFDASICLAQTRLALNAGNVYGAAAALAAGRKALPAAFRELYATDLEFLQARLDWEMGDAATAFRSLNQLILEKAEVDDTEAWLYLALAAEAAGHREELVTALAEVQARGVDVGLMLADPAGSTAIGEADGADGGEVGAHGGRQAQLEGVGDQGVADRNLEHLRHPREK